MYLTTLLLSNNAVELPWFSASKISLSYHEFTFLQAFADKNFILFTSRSHRFNYPIFGPCERVVFGFIRCEKERSGPLIGGALQSPEIDSK